jgi:hypothetical protein
MNEMFYLITGIIFLLSIGLNIFLFWFNRNLLRRMFFISEHMATLVEEVVGYHNHLNSVHELEIFYGDETLGELLRHSNGLIETLEDFEEIYTMFGEENEELFEEVTDDGATDTKTQTEV